MRMAHLMITLLVAGTCIPVVAQIEDQAATPNTKPKITILYPLPELYMGKENGTQIYIKAALEFIQKNPNSPFLPRMFMDIYMSAIYTGNVKLAQQVRTSLLWNTPNHLYGSYVLSTFKTPQQLHDFIVPYISSQQASLEKNYCEKLYQLIAASIHMQGWDFLKNPSFMIKCAALLDRAAPDDLNTAMKDQVKSFIDADSEESKIADICFNRNLNLLDKIAALDSELPDNPTARFVRMVYMVDLDQTQLASADMLKIRSRQYLQQGRYDLAQLEIQKLIGVDSQSQYRYWLGWSQAAQGQADAAMTTLNQVPSAPWRGLAQRLAHQINNMAENLGQHSQIVSAMITDLTQNLDGLEMTVQGKLPDGKPFDLYIGIGPDQNVYLQLKENGRVEVAYHSTSDRCQVYLEKHARKFSTQGSVPIPIFSINKNEQTGKFSFQFAISIKPYAQMADALKNCLTSEYLTTDQGLSQLMVGMIQKGAFPAAPAQSIQGIELKWLIPTLDDLQLSQRVFTVDSVGKLLSVTSPNLSIVRIKYGPRQQMVLSAPSMPRANYVQATDADDAFRVTAYNRILKTLITATK